MLSSVHFQSIKALADLRLDLGRLTFLVGPNGCGKSTVLDQIELLCGCSLPAPGTPHPFGRAGELLAGAGLCQMYTVGSTQPMVWEGRDTAGNTFSIECSAPAETDRYDYPSLRAGGDGHELTLNRANHTGEQRRVFDQALATQLSWRAQRLRLVPQSIAAPADVRVDDLEPDGSGLAAVLMELALNDHDAYAALQEDLRAIVPQFERLQISRVQVQDAQQVKHGGVALGMVMRGAGRQPASAISDGTLLALALLTATHNADMPPLVLMDDIDHGLHLGAQLALVQAIRKVMEVRPDLQVVCTTHSPYLLDAARPEEVRVMALDADGHSRLRPLTDHPDYERQHRGLQTGEFWASFGEEWVVDGG